MQPWAWRCCSAPLTACYPRPLCACARRCPWSVVARCPCPFSSVCSLLLPPPFSITRPRQPSSRTRAMTGVLQLNAMTNASRAASAAAPRRRRAWRAVALLVRSNSSELGALHHAERHTRRSRATASQRNATPRASAVHAARCAERGPELAFQTTTPAGSRRRRHRRFRVRAPLCL